MTWDSSVTKVVPIWWEFKCWHLFFVLPKILSLWLEAMPLLGISIVDHCEPKIIRKSLIVCFCTGAKVWQEWMLLGGTLSVDITKLNASTSALGMGGLEADLPDSKESLTMSMQLFNISRWNSGWLRVASPLERDKILYYLSEIWRETMIKKEILTIANLQNCRWYRADLHNPHH